MVDREHLDGAEPGGRGVLVEGRAVRSTVPVAADPSSLRPTGRQCSTLAA